MSAKSLQELFVEELRDMYDGEKRLIRALPKMAKAAGASELQNAFTKHLRETEKQVERLEQVFRACGETPRGKKCDGIMGIVEESNKAMEELEGPVLDAALIAGAQKVEHYEIASYGTLAYFADLLGDDRSKRLLGQTLDEEKAADEKLSQIAKSTVNREALMGAEQSGEWAGVSLPLPGTLSEVAALGFANERTAKKRASSGRSSTSRSSSRSATGRTAARKRSTAKKTRRS
jgi:ferritin-like metal-binding protein YciE